MCHRAVVTVLSVLLGVGFIDRLECSPYGNPHFAPGRQVIVNLFEWKWNDIAIECEKYLGPRGFAGVQTSPVTENLILPSRPWLERYMPISYRWITRSGNESEFKDMVRRCNKVGVRIYVDLVLNHMTAKVTEVRGTGGSAASPEIRDYPGVPYTRNDFNPHCMIRNWSDVNQVRNCFFIGYDLDQSNENVRRKIVTLMNKLVAAGVAGFRIDYAALMWPEDLKEIYSRVRFLNVKHGFPKNARPYIYQRVQIIDDGSSWKQDYSPIGSVIEVLYTNFINSAVNGLKPLKDLKEIGEVSGFAPSDNAVVFTDSSELQRLDSRHKLSYKSLKLYKTIVAFIMAHPYGQPIVMSSYAIGNNVQGPPADEDENIISPGIKNDGSCNAGWICEHRWRPVHNMVNFRNVVSGTSIEHWWENDCNQIAFSRGDRGFVAINGNKTMNFVETIQTNLQAGVYCDVISGSFVNGRCTGEFVNVDENGKAEVNIFLKDPDAVIAIHRDAKLWPEW